MHPPFFSLVSYPSLVLPARLTPTFWPCGSDSPTGQSKKSKKNQANKLASAAALAMDVGDRAALNRRAERFRREHEIEKQKQNGGGGQASSLRANQRTTHPFVNLSRSATPIANADDPEADPVSILLFFRFSKKKSRKKTHRAAGVAERAELGSAYHCRNISRDFQGLLTFDISAHCSSSFGIV
jgi:hypothetical protein